MKRFAFTSLLILVVISGARAFSAEAVLTLEDAIKTALENNPSVEAKKQSANSLSHKVGQAKSGFWPQLQGDAGYKRSTMNSSSPKMKTQSSDSQNNFSTGINIGVTILDFGKTSGAVDAAKFNAEAGAEDYADARGEAVYQTVQAYFGVLAAQENLQAAVESKKRMEKRLDLAKARFDAKMTQKIDVIRAESDAAAANLALIKAQNVLARAKLALKTSLGVDSDAQFEVVKPELKFDAPPSDRAGAVKKVLEKRPDYKSLALKLNAAKASLSSVKSGYWPTLTANGGFNYGGYQPQDMVYNWTIGASLNWNIFSGFYTDESKAQAEADVKTVQAQIKAMENSVKNEIETAAIDYAEAFEKVEPAELLLESATENLRLAEERYAAGLGGAIEISDAQTLYVQAKVGAIQAQYDCMTAGAAYLKAAGEITSLLKK